MVKMNTTAADGSNICVATCKINIADQDKLNTFYNNLSDGLEITSEIADNWTIENLVGDFADKFDEIHEVYAVSICRKICEKKMLKKAILLYGGNAQKGYNFCNFFNNYFWVNLWPGSFIPSDWIGAKLFYVQKAVTSITLSSSTLKLVVGEADVKLQATVKPDDAADKTVTWSSDNEAAATVVDGKVHAVAVGKATITAKAGDKTATCAITVLPAAAQITTEPVATTGTIVAGSTTPLVTAGVASGGTMMYAVTTTKTKPTSTAGFSATVPTAATLAAGTYYVWYYAKADATHSNGEICSSAIAVTVTDALVVNE